MLDARVDGWLHAAERQVGKLCLRENAVATQGELLQAEDVASNTFLRTFLCLSHVLVRFMLYLIGDERREQGFNDV